MINKVIGLLFIMPFVFSLFLLILVGSFKKQPPDIFRRTFNKMNPIIYGLIMGAFLYEGIYLLIKWGLMISKIIGFICLAPILAMFATLFYFKSDNGFLFGLSVVLLGASILLLSVLGIYILLKWGFMINKVIGFIFLVPVLALLAMCFYFEAKDNGFLFTLSIALVSISIFLLTVSGINLLLKWGIMNITELVNCPYCKNEFYIARIFTGGTSGGELCYVIFIGAQH
jgi:hypothetical protein